MASLEMEPDGRQPVDDVPALGVDADDLVEAVVVPFSETYVIVVELLELTEDSIVYGLWKLD